MRHRARVVTATLACTLALVAGCADQSSDEPATGGADGSVASETEGTAAGTSIPADFPLSSGMGAPTEPVATSRTGTGLRDLELCGTSPLRGLGTRDRMVADNSGGESADTRELLVLGAPGDARRLAERLTALVSDCTDRPLRSNAAASTFTGFFASSSDGRGWRTARTTATADSVPPGSANGAATTLSGRSARGRTPWIVAGVSGASVDAVRSPRLPPA